MIQSGAEPIVLGDFSVKDHPPVEKHNTMAGIPISVREARRMGLSITHTLFQYAGIFPATDAYSLIFLQLPL